MRWCWPAGSRRPAGNARRCSSNALDACERYFPAFQFVVWAGKTAREAIDAAMFETAGEA